MNEEPSEQPPKKPRKQRKRLGRRQAKRTNTKLTDETRKIWEQGPAAWAGYMRACKLKLPLRLRSRVGIGDGMRRAEAEIHWAEASRKADIIMAYLEKHNMI